MATRTDDRINPGTAPDQATEAAPFDEAAAAAARSMEPDNASPGGLTPLRERLDELARLKRPRDFPEFFARFAEQTGLRLLLLKRWTSGLQVFMETNIRVPPEARRKGPDGRAPIPCEKHDLFRACGEDAAVYAGPVPQKHFPLDLTLILGRGSRDRQIVVLPLPSNDHWNTFLYLDAGRDGERALEVAEILARFALQRMVNQAMGFDRERGRVSAILKGERQRRREAQVRRRRALERTELPEVDPFGDAVDVAPADREEPVASPPVIEVAAPGEEIDPFAAPARVEPPATVPVDPTVLTPASILKHSGELPALPRAACHIMAVIDDHRTTATALEKALAMDQALTAKVLRIANSPFYGAVREISTVSEAVVRLGFVSIRNWTLVTAARSVFLGPGAGMLYQRIWKQSVLSAMSAQLVAQTVGGREPENVFVGGLMQNIGQLVLARSHPELFQRILAESADTGYSYHEVERALLGFDHGELGALLIAEWNLSAELEDAVRWHHRFEEPEAVNVRMAAMISLGEEIAVCSWAGANEGDEEPSPPKVGPAARLLGLSEAQLADLHRQAAALHIDPHFFN